MKLLPTTIRGVFIAEATPFVDHRGAFARWYCMRELSDLIGERQIVQVNLSRTINSGAIRGMHYQNPPIAEMKFVRCIKGRAWDVVVDLRSGSSTFLKWHAEELTSKNERMVIVPEGCAHGYQALEPNSELLYLTTAFYSPENEGGVACDDPQLAITWPLAVADLSVKDREHPFISHDFHGIKV